MSSINDVSGRLGEYMLKGWILTDQSCPTPSCNVPLMRSPSGRVPVTQFCANCDDGPGIPQPKPAISIPDSSSSISSDSHVSRSSTPPTEISSTLSSPVFAPPVDTEESRRRREQSDRASSEIGKRLLKGWAMLADECPNTRCYGVPLVRAPRAGGEKDSRKECVICGNIYVTEVDWAGRERLVRADLDSRHDTASISTSRGRMQVQEGTPQATKDLLPLQGSAVSLDGHALPHTTDPQPVSGLVRARPTIQALEESSQALQSTLQTLSVQLTNLSGTCTAIDLSSIGSTADAISKVTQALNNVKQLQWSEIQAQRL